MIIFAGASQELLQIAQNRQLTLQERLQAAISFFTEGVNYSTLAQAVQVVIALIRNNDEAKQYIRRNWKRSTHYYSTPEPSDIPFVVELATQEVLPTEARDSMYKILQEMIPLFESLNESRDQ